jgi:hypothetical protein
MARCLSGAKPVYPPIPVFLPYYRTSSTLACGPFVPGRKILDSTGSFKSVVGGLEFGIIGGDGLINSDPTSQCHIPLTATVKHGGKQIKVKIVDRCVGCKEGDIDLTPAAFAALANMGLGRTDVEWQFVQY